MEWIIYGAMFLVIGLLGFAIGRIRYSDYRDMKTKEQDDYEACKEINDKG